MLTLSNIQLTLGGNEPNPLFSNLNLSVCPGEFLVIIGGNGTGKSTLFNLIAGDRMPDSGSVMLNGQDINNVNKQTRAALVARVVQDPKMGTMANMSIEENLSLAYLRGQSRGLSAAINSKRRQWFRDKLALLQMNLENRLGEPVGCLSGGQRQALALIMAIVTDSKILLLDEITAALDPKTAEQVMAITHTVVTEERRTTLLITHHIGHAIEYGDRTVLLAQRRIAKEFKGIAKKRLTPSTLMAQFL